MIMLSYDEIKEREVNILNYIKDICNKNDLKYELIVRVFILYLTRVDTIII